MKFLLSSPIFELGSRHQSQQNSKLSNIAHFKPSCHATAPRFQTIPFPYKRITNKLFHHVSSRRGGWKKKECVSEVNSIVFSRGNAQLLFFLGVF